VKYGVHSPRLIGERSKEIAEGLVQSFEFTPAERLAVAEAARCIALLEAIDNDLDERGIVDGRGKERRLLELRVRVSGRLERWLDKFAGAMEQQLRGQDVPKEEPQEHEREPRVGPLEALRGALLATKRGGEPDWPTRVSAARVLAALCPDEVQPKKEPTPSIIVYDLPPGTESVLHRAPNEAKTPVSAPETPSEPPTIHFFSYERPDGKSDAIGTWSDPRHDWSRGGYIKPISTGDPEIADQWRAELAAGRLPQSPPIEP
jgi:hypothetical protein